MKVIWRQEQSIQVEEICILSGFPLKASFSRIAVMQSYLYQRVSILVDDDVIIDNYYPNADCIQQQFLI